MKNELSNLKKYSLYCGVFALSLGVSSCSDDDDGDVIDPDRDATGSFTVDDQTISQNTLVLNNVSAGQDSWILVRNSANEVVSDTIAVDENHQGDLRIPLNENAGFSGTDGGDALTISFYEDDDDEGIQGELDSEDDLIEDASDNDIVRTINVTGPSLAATDGQEITANNEVTFTSVRTAGDSWIVLFDDEDNIIGSRSITADDTENVTVPFNEEYIYNPGDNIHARLHIDAEPVGTYDEMDVQETYGYGEDGEAAPYAGTSFTAAAPAGA